MEKLKEALIQFAYLNPNLFPNDASNSYPMLIEQCFPQMFSDLQTPNHPPYAAMIYKAIREVNKKGGCSEKSISKYIKKEYADLPWAHSTLLKHHLKKLCDRKELCMTHKQCYLLAGAESETGNESSQRSKKRKKQKTTSGSDAGKNRGRPHKKHKKKEKCVLGVRETSDKEQIGLDKRKRKRKQRLKSKQKISKHLKKQTLNEGSSNEPREQKQMLEVNSCDMQIQEQNERDQESNHDNSGCIKFEEIQMKNLELLQPEESPDSNPILHRNGKRVWTRSQLKTISKEDSLAGSSELTDSPSCANMPKDKPAVVEALSNEKQPISRSPSSEKPLIELLKHISSKSMPRSPADEPTTGPSSTEVQDPISTQQYQQPEKPLVEDEPKCKRRGRPRKHTEPEKGEVLCNSRSAAYPRKNQKLVKNGKDGNKKDQPVSKRDGRHTMTRRSGRNTRS